MSTLFKFINKKPKYEELYDTLLKNYNLDKATLLFFYLSMNDWKEAKHVFKDPEDIKSTCMSMRSRLNYDDRFRQDLLNYIDYIPGKDTLAHSLYTTAICATLDSESLMSIFDGKAARIHEDECNHATDSVSYNIKNRELIVDNFTDRITLDSTEDYIYVSSKEELESYIFTNILAGNGTCPMFKLTGESNET